MNKQDIKRGEVVLSNTYTFNLYGPGIDTQIIIKEYDDLEIVDMVLKKIRNEFEEKLKECEDE